MREVVRGIVSKEVDGVKKYLLMSSKRDFKEFTGFYYPVGGGVETGESQEEALIREFKEEVNLEVKPDRLITTTPADLPDQEVNWWLCTIASGDLKILDENILDVGFFSLEEVKNRNLWPATKTFFEKFIL